MGKFSRLIGVFLVVFAVVISPVFASILTVCPIDCTYNSIQTAINAASEGDTVLVGDGTYTENIDVTKNNITIKSENGAERTIIEAANSSDYVFEIKSSYVALEGFSVQGAMGWESDGIYYGRAGVVSFGYNCRLSNNIALNNYYGFFLDRSNNCRLFNNIARDNNDSGFSVNGNSYVFINNTANSNGRSGFEIAYSTNTTMINNTAKENNYRDIEVEAHSDQECDNKLENTLGSGNRLIGYYNSSINLTDQVFSELILCNADNSNLNNITIDGSTTKTNNGLVALLQSS